MMCPILSALTPTEVKRLTEMTDREFLLSCGYRPEQITDYPDGTAGLDYERVIRYRTRGEFIEDDA